MDDIIKSIDEVVKKRVQKEVNKIQEDSDYKEKYFNLISLIEQSICNFKLEINHCKKYKYSVDLMMAESSYRSFRYLCEEANIVKYLNELNELED